MAPVPTSSTGEPVTHYDKAQVVMRVEEALGRRLTNDQLYKARAAERQARGVKPGRMRLTVGMPAPDPDDPQGRWRADAIEHWLNHHPLHELADRTEILRRAVASPVTDTRSAVREAKEWGLSWAQIADVVGDVEGRPLTRQAAELRYG